MDDHGEQKALEFYAKKSGLELFYPTWRFNDFDAILCNPVTDVAHSEAVEVVEFKSSPYWGPWILNGEEARKSPYGANVSLDQLQRIWSVAEFLQADPVLLYKGPVGPTSKDLGLLRTVISPPYPVRLMECKSERDRNSAKIGKTEIRCEIPWSAFEEIARTSK